MDFLASFSDDNIHELLEPPSVAYSNVTVRRAFVVWMHCGQKNRFKDVCNYYHHLEALEETLPIERRTTSRNHEFQLFTEPPPKSLYLMHNFPHLYTELHYPKKEAKAYDDNIQKLREFDKIAHRSGTSRCEIVEASRMIRNYCRTHMKSLERFMKEFKEHTVRCGLTHTVGNVGPYIKRKIIEAEIELEANYAATVETMKKYDANNLVDKSGSFEIQCKTEGKPVTGSNFLKDTNDIIVTKILTKPNRKDKDKKGYTEEKPLVTVTGNNVVMDFISKFQSCCNNESSKEDNNEKVYDNLLDTAHDYNVTDDSKIRSRRFSGSNFIKKDLIKLRNI